MYANTSKARTGIKQVLKKSAAFCILLIGALAPGRLRVWYSGFLHNVNYVKKGKETIGARLSKFFYGR